MCLANNIGMTGPLFTSRIWKKMFLLWKSYPRPITCIYIGLGTTSLTKLGFSQNSPWASTAPDQNGLNPMFPTKISPTLSGPGSKRPLSKTAPLLNGALAQMWGCLIEGPLCASVWGYPRVSHMTISMKQHEQPTLAMIWISKSVYMIYGS